MLARRYHACPKMAKKVAIHRKDDFLALYGPTLPHTTPPPISCLGLGLGLGVRVDAPWVPYGFGSQVTVSLACKSEAMRRVSALHCTRSSTHNEPQFAHSNPSPRCIFQELKQKREKEKEQAAARRVRMSAACVCASVTVSVRVAVGDGQRARR